MLILASEFSTLPEGCPVLNDYDAPATIAARRSGLGRRAIATQMGRTRDAVRGRMVLLGIK